MLAYTEIPDPDSQTAFSGCVAKPGDLIRILRLLELCKVDGRLRIATDTGCGDVFFDEGRILAAMHLSHSGTAALRAILQEPGVKRFSLHPWALLDGVVARVEDDLLERLATHGTPFGSATRLSQHERGQSAAETTQVAGLITSLVSDIHGRYPSPADALEVTAVLESLGITDEVAAQRYGRSDVFALAEEVHTGLRLLPGSA